MEANMISKALEEKIKAAETLEDVVKACAEEGIEVTREQLEAGLAQTEGGELSENALDKVSGGIFPIISPGIIWKVVRVIILARK